MDTEDSKGLVNSVLRACRVVELLATDGPEVSLSHAAEAADLTRPTAHRLLATLTAAGWVRRTSTGRYALTGKLAGVGAAASQGGALKDVAHPLVEQVALATGDTAYLIVTREDQALCIDRMEGPHPIRVHHVNIGDLLPLTAGAGPVVILAHRPDLQAGLQLSPAQKERLEEACRKGYVVSPDDLLPGVTAIGAPVRDAGGQVVAGLSVTGTNDRLRGRHRTEVITQLVAAADQISELLGHRTAAPGT
jgi:DNA-binding IclR family transcriptional regulator